MIIDTNKLDNLYFDNIRYHFSNETVKLTIKYGIKIAFDIKGAKFYEGKACEYEVTFFVPDFSLSFGTLEELEKALNNRTFL